MEKIEKQIRTIIKKLKGKSYNASGTIMELEVLMKMVEAEREKLIVFAMKALEKSK